MNACTVSRLALEIGVGADIVRDGPLRALLPVHPCATGGYRLLDGAFSPEGAEPVAPIQARTTLSARCEAGQGDDVRPPEERQKPGAGLSGMGL